MDLRHQDGKAKEQNEKVRLKSDTSVVPLDIVDLGINLKEFYKSVEWDILEVPASRYLKEQLSYKSLKNTKPNLTISFIAINTNFNLVEILHKPIINCSKVVEDNYNTVWEISHSEDDNTKDPLNLVLIL